MEAYMPISFLNDFIFCPRSIYFHQLYGKSNKRLYQTTYQTRGINAHKTIDKKSYSSSGTVLQGFEIFSEKYRIGGKIDTFDVRKGLLVERKKKITVIYDGYIFQLYAQYFCLTEMGYTVKRLKLYSLDTNKSYHIKTPEEDPQRKKDFELLIDKMRLFSFEAPFQSSPNKCQNCIYNPLCDISKC